MWENFGLFKTKKRNLDKIVASNEQISNNSAT